MDTHEPAQRDEASADEVPSGETSREGGASQKHLPAASDGAPEALGEETGLSGTAAHRGSTPFVAPHAAGGRGVWSTLPVGRLLRADAASIRLDEAREVALGRAVWLLAVGLLVVAGIGALILRAAGLVLWPAGWLGVGADDPFQQTLFSAAVLVALLAPVMGVVLRCYDALGEALTRRLMRSARRAARRRMRALEGEDGLLPHFGPLLARLARADGRQVDRLRLSPGALDALKELGAHPRVEEMMARLAERRYEAVNLRIYHYVLVRLQALARAVTNTDPATKNTRSPAE